MRGEYLIGQDTVPTIPSEMTLGNTFFIFLIIKLKTFIIV